MSLHRPLAALLLTTIFATSAAAQRIKAAWAYIHQPRNAAKYTAAEVRTIKARVRRAAKARKVTLPDPDDFVELMDRVRKKRK
jgi:hypothetical protein